MSDLISSNVNGLDVRRSHFAEHDEEVWRAALTISDAISAGGKLLLFDKGSATASYI